MSFTPTTPQASTTNGKGSTPPYWERIEPVCLEADNGFRIRAFDDREGPTESVHVQLSTKRGRTATYKARNVTELRDLENALATIRKGL